MSEFSFETSRDYSIARLMRYRLPYLRDRVTLGWWRYVFGSQSFALGFSMLGKLIRLLDMPGWWWVVGLGIVIISETDLVAGPRTNSRCWLFLLWGTLCILIFARRGLLVTLRPGTFA